MVFLQGAIQGPRLLPSCSSTIFNTWIPSCSRDFPHSSQLAGGRSRKGCTEEVFMAGSESGLLNSGQAFLFLEFSHGFTPNLKGLLRNCFFSTGRWRKRLGDKPAVSYTCISFLKDWQPIASKNNAAVNIPFLILCAKIFLIHKPRDGMARSLDMSMLLLTKKCHFVLWTINTSLLSPAVNKDDSIPTSPSIFLVSAFLFGRLICTQKYIIVI